MKIVIKNKPPIKATLKLNDAVKRGHRGAARRWMAEFKPAVEEYANKLLEAAEREHKISFHTPLNMEVNFFHAGDKPVIYLIGRATELDTYSTVYVELFMNEGSTASTCWMYKQEK